MSGFRRCRWGFEALGNALARPARKSPRKPLCTILAVEELENILGPNSLLSMLDAWGDRPPRLFAPDEATPGQSAPRSGQRPEDAALAPSGDTTFSHALLFAPSGLLAPDPGSQDVHGGGGAATAPAPADTPSPASGANFVFATTFAELVAADSLFPPGFGKSEPAPQGTSPPAPVGTPEGGAGGGGGGAGGDQGRSSGGSPDVPLNPATSGGAGPYASAGPPMASPALMVPPAPAGGPGASPAAGTAPATAASQVLPPVAVAPSSSPAKDRSMDRSLPVQGQPPQTPAPASAPDQTTAANELAVTPLRFEANVGQSAAPVQFLSRGQGYGVFLTATEAVLALRPTSAPDTPTSEPPVDVVRLQLVGSNPQAQATGQGLLPTRTNYYIGNVPSQWHPNVPNFARVDFHNVYPGVDLWYHGDSQSQLEYDFVVAPGADPSAIQLQVTGVQGLHLDGQGNLVLATAGGDLVHHAPVIYQDAGGSRQAVPGQYVLAPEGRVRFQLGTYDPSRPLVIDPVVSYSTFLGGSANDYGNAIAVDNLGRAYVTGQTFSLNFPGTGGGLHGSRDAFVSRLNATGTALEFSTYLGGSVGDSTETGLGIAVDPSYNIVVTGATSATDFPTTLGPPNAGGSDAFVTAFGTTGSAMLWSRYFGGSGTDQGQAVAIIGSLPVPGQGGAVLPAGSVWITGFTTSPNLPLQSPLPYQDH